MLKSAALGTRLRIDGPSGVMVLHEDAARPAVFLGGGFIRRDMLERHLADLRIEPPSGGPNSPVYYFAGPPGMTMAMQLMLESLGIGENDMRSEEFYGY